MSKQKANFFCLLTAVIWGGGFVATELGLGVFTTFAFLFLRFAGAAILAWLPVWFHHEKVSKEALKIGVVSGVLLYTAFAFQTFGLERTTTGMNAFLTAVNVIFVPFIVWVIYHKKPDPIVFAAAVICLIGIGCLSLSGGSFSFNTGDLLTLICAFFFAAQIVSLDRAKSASAIVINAVQLTTAALCALPFGLTTTWPAHIPLGGYISVGYSIVLATFVCYLLQTTAQQYTSPAACSILLCTESLWGNLFGFLILHEAKSPIMIVGGLLIFGSVLLVEAAPTLEASPFWKRLIHRYSQQRG